MQAKRVDFVVVEYNSPGVAIACVNSLVVASQAAPQIEIGVFLVSNGIVDSGLTEALDEWQSCIHIHHLTANNVGYLGALALYHANREGAGYTGVDFVVLANADLQFDRFFLRAMGELDIDRGNVGLIGPSIVSMRTRRDQNPMFLERPDRSYLLRMEMILRCRVCALVWQLLHLLKKAVLGLWPDPSSSGDPKLCSQNVYAIHGSCMALAEDFFALKPWEDYRAFLYSEELYLAERLRMSNQKAVFIPSLKVRHHEHISTGWIRSVTQNKWQWESLRFVRETYFDID